MARLWLSVEVVSGCTVPFGSRIINCYQEETFTNLLSRLEEDKFKDPFFLPVTRVYFVIKLARATKRQVGWPKYGLTLLNQVNSGRGSIYMLSRSTCDGILIRYK